MQPFSLDPTSPVPLTLQLKEQLRLQIRLGLLRPGARLPGLRELARRTGLNRNTVIHAIAELEAEGYVHSEHGRGIFVADRPPGPAGSTLRAALELGRERAAALGVAPAELGLALLAYGQLVDRRTTRPERVLVVGGHRRVVEALRAELEAALPVYADAALSDELPPPPVLTRYRAVIATLFHAAETAQSLARLGLGVPVIAAAGPEVRSAWERLRTLPAATRVVLLAADWVQAGRVRRSLAAAGLEHLDIDVRAGRADHALPDAAGAILQAASRSALPAPAAPHGVLVVTEPAALSPEVTDELREAVGAPSRPARPPVSPWF